MGGQLKKAMVSASANDEVTPFQFTPAQLDWIKALKSGRYKQSTEELQSDNGYCCLGVGAVRAGLKGGVILSRDTTTFLSGGELDGQPGVRQYLGLRSDTGRPDKFYSFRGDIVDHSLVTLNDKKDASFKEIADVLENNPEAFFVCPPEQVALVYIRELDEAMQELSQLQTDLHIAVTLATDAKCIYENAADFLVMLANRKLGE